MATVNRALPSKVQTPGGYADSRADSYGNVLNAPMSYYQQASDEGTYWTAVNATDNTAITGSIATAYSATASAFIALRNNDVNPDSGTGKRIILDYIKLITKTVPASAADWRAVVDVDTVQTRFTSGGTAITPANSNSGASGSSIALLNAGALTTVALTAAGRTLGREVLRGVIPVALESYMFMFGAVDKGGRAGAVINGTNPQTFNYYFPPCVLTQNACMCLSLFGTSNAATAVTYQVEMGWIER